MAPPQLQPQPGLCCWEFLLGYWSWLLLLPPKELWLFLGCCSSSFSGIFASGAALEKQGEKPFQCQHRDLFEGSSWNEEPDCSFSVYVLQGETTQTPANPLSFVRESREQELLLEHLLPLL